MDITRLPFGFARVSSYSGRSAGAPASYSPAYGGIPQLPRYSTDTSTVMHEDPRAQMIANLPNYLAMIGKDSSNIGYNLAGVVNPDVLNLMQQQAAERGIATGVYGSQNADAAYLRALGLTSLQLQQIGHTQLNEAIARTPVQKSESSTMVHDNAAEQAVYNAAPVPWAAAEQAIKNAQAAYSYGKNTASTGSNRRNTTLADGFYVSPYVGSNIYTRYA